MRVFDALKQLRADSEFKRWHKANPDFYLAHVFVIIDKPEQQEADHLHEVDIGFFNPKDQKMISFIVGDDVEIKEHDEIFREPGSKIDELHEDKIKIRLSEALKKAAEIQKEKYKAQLPVKKISILQNLKGFGDCWNITYVTAQFKTLNIKINAETGEVLDEKLVEIMQFGK